MGATHFLTRTLHKVRTEMMASYQRHARAFSFGGIAAVVVALIAAIMIGRRPGYELPVVAFIAGGIAMLAALTWWGGQLGIGRAEIFLGIDLALVAWPACA